MFRSPNDVWSSESESNTSDEEIEVSRISTSKSTTAETSASSSQHASLITASLLEFHYSVRAAEILNVAHQGPSRYDRHSPEAKALAKKMFANGSQLLASHGMLAEGLHSDELQGARQWFLTGIDSLGLGALREAGALPPTPRLALEGPRPTSDLLSNLNIDPIARQRDSFLSQINQITLPSPISNTQFSRYTTDFTEVSQLGRGGFGAVYHVINLVDNQHYAIKKIGLDPRRLKRRWQEGGLEEVENVLREIRTLASLEHGNVVRYFGAWIEQPASASVLGETQGSRPLNFRRLLENRSEEASHGTNSVSDPGGIVFGEDSAPGHSVKELSENEPTSAMSLSDETDIFTDGDGRGVRSRPQNPNQITLCLQMSLHQMNLASYLSPPGSEHICHCFHLRPSLSIFLGILSGVQYLHSAGIVHRDLKPANIFLSEDAVLRPSFVDATCRACPERHSRYLNARIGDFGLVGNIMEELSAPASVSNKVVGTEFYRPPHPSILTPGTSYEDTEDKAFVKPMTSAMMIDEKIDVFALGVLLFELLWRFETRSERFVVLTTLTRVGALPAGFCGMVDRPRTSGTDCRRSEGKEEVWEPPGVDAADRQPGRQSLKLANIIAECIAGMVHSNPAERWDCARVKKCIEGVLEMC